MSAAAPGAWATISCVAATTAAHSAAGSWVATSPSRTVVMGRAAAATSRPVSSTSATLAFVVPTSIPSAWVTPGGYRPPARSGRGGVSARVAFVAVALTRAGRTVVLVAVAAVLGRRGRDARRRGEVELQRARSVGDGELG